MQSKAEEFAELCTFIPHKPKERDAFLMDNRDLIARALRRDEAIEEPSDVLIAFCGDAVTEAMTEGRLKGYSLARVALVAFREAVK